MLGNTTVAYSLFGEKRKLMRKDLDLKEFHPSITIFYEECNFNTALLILPPRRCKSEVESQGDTGSHSG